MIGQIFESARESGEEDNQTAILYVNQEKEKNKKESEVKFPKTDTRQSKKRKISAVIQNFLRARSRCH